MFRWCLPLILLSACTAPSSYFRDAPVTRIAIDGSVFDVRVKGELAEAVRVNAQYAPRLGPIGDRAGAAMTAASGCKLDRVLGDAALITGLLDCDGRPRRLPWPVYSRGYDCLEVDNWTDAGLGVAYSEFECSAI